MSVEDKRTVLRNDVVDYDQTVKAILAFAALVVFDGAARLPDAEFGLGRRMRTSPQNPINPDSDVTPDIVAQRSLAYGIAVEVKKSLDRDSQHWKRHIEQLRKYDDQLRGWWTDDESIQHSDAVILVHVSRSRQFKAFVKQEVGRSPDAFGPHSCVVEFIDSQETAHYYFFRREHGSIQDQKLAGRLEDGVQVPLDDVLCSFPTIKYYDSEPPLPRLLTDLWIDILPAMAAEEEYDESLNAYTISASVRAVTAEMQIAYGSAALQMDKRATEFPKHSWIRGAFEALVQFDLASPPSDESDVYVIHYRHFRKDVLTRFIDLAARPRKRLPKTKAEQLSLLDN